jgi:3' terminal RNA ribose 2'-O-methyltransferase Hen1
MPQGPRTADGLLGALTGIFASRRLNRLCHTRPVLLTVTTTMEPATDLGYLLHKHPDQAQRFHLAVGTAHVVYPEASAARCTAALILEVDPVGLVRGTKKSPDFALGQYVNDRPYAASSMLAVALGQVFRTAIRGDCKARPELPATEIPLEMSIPALPCRGGASLAVELFEPLGWSVEAVAVPLDPAFPDWGDSRYVGLTLRGAMRLSEALKQLYVLLPVLDDAKHYWVSTDEIDKLIRAGEGWLENHPKRDLITRRYVSHKMPLARAALARLAEVDDAEAEAIDNATAEATLVRPSLADARHAAVIEVLHEAQAQRVLDIGCGPGALLRLLLADHRFTAVTGTDVSHRALEMAARRLRLETMSERQADRITLLQSSATYRDKRLRGYDAAVLMEVIEHVDPPRLPALTASIFGDAAPATVVVTTPNVEYNVRYEGLRAGGKRHADHRFEWTRAEFAEWAEQASVTYGYSVTIRPVGDVDDEVGAPTQMAVFTR